MLLRPPKRTARLLGYFILATMFLQVHPQPVHAADGKTEARGSVITMPSYSLVSPFGKEWQFESDERKESIRFERVIKPSHFSKDVFSSSSVQVFRKKTPRDQRGFSQDKVADV